MLFSLKKEQNADPDTIHSFLQHKTYIPYSLPLTGHKLSHIKYRNEYLPFSFKKIT